MSISWSQGPVSAGRSRQPKGERGIALVFALLGILLVSMLAASLMVLSNQEAYASFNYKSQTQASYVTMAGAQRTIDWFHNGTNAYEPWLKTPTAVTATAAYSVTEPDWVPKLGGSRVSLGGAACGGTANFPFADVSTSFNNLCSDPALAIGNTSGNYRMTATLIGHDRYFGPNCLDTRILERWRMDVTGRLRSLMGGTEVQETAIIQSLFRPLLPNAIQGQCQVQINGSVVTDSFSSSAGPYGGSNVYTGPDANSNIGTNSYVGASGSSGVINGNVYYGETVAGCTGEADLNNPGIVQGTIEQAPGFPYPGIEPPFTTGPANPNQCGSAGPYAFYPNTPNLPTVNSPLYGRCTLLGGSSVDFPNQLTKMQLRVPNTDTRQSFFLYGIDVQTANARIEITHLDGSPCLPTDPPAARCAPVAVYVKGLLQIAGAGIVGEIPGDPTRLAIYYEGTANAVLGGSSAFYGTIYAPNSTLVIQGGTNIYGAVSAKNVTAQGDITVHYDLNLSKMCGTTSAFRISKQSRTIF